MSVRGIATDDLPFEWQGVKYHTPPVIPFFQQKFGSTIDVARHLNPTGGEKDK